MPKASKPKNIFDTILHWSDRRPLWQQDALRRIIRSGTLSENDIKATTALAKRPYIGAQSLMAPETKSYSVSAIDIEAAPLNAVHLPSAPEVGSSIRITSISDIEGVNQLAAKQTLTFEIDGLTVVYGPNGSGKSGYSRILKRACRARMPGEILSDVSESEPINPSAKIGLKFSDGSEETVEWTDSSTPNPTLSAITVFDRESGAVHIQKKNEAWFTPFGLDIPNTLASLCDSIADRLKTERNETERARSSVFDAPIWFVDSTLGTFMESLTEDSDVGALFDTVSFTEKDDARLERLTVDLASENDPVVSAERKRRTAENIERLRATIERLDAVLSNGAMKALQEARENAGRARAAAMIASEAAFGDLSLSGVGDPVWRELWDAARRYAQVAGEPVPHFPPSAGDSCLLCHQEVSDTAADRMRGFDAFIRKDTERVAKEAEISWRDAFATVADAHVETRAFSEALRSLREHDAELSRCVRRCFASMRLRRAWLVKNASDKNALDAPELTVLNLSNLSATAAAIRAHADEIAASADPEVRAKLVSECNDLRDQKQKDVLRVIAEEEVERLKRIRILHLAIKDCASRPVTMFSNALADEFITARMHDCFQREIVALAGEQVRVEVTRSGGRAGAPQFEVKLFANNKKAKIHMVLSEGEQTCVALAAYLTELANAEHRSALVFDDPVTSLDHQWRRKVAERLVREAGNRQIVVFTHDLIFVNDLDTLAQETKTPIGLRHLVRTSNGVGVVNEGLPWKGAKLPERFDSLEKSAREAKQLYDAGEHDDYEGDAFQIYDKLRATWERGLEDVVFAQVIVRHRDYINTKRLKAVTVFTEEDAEVALAAYNKCCDYVRSHDPSRGRDAAAPAPDDIFSDIEIIKKWVKDLRERQKAFG